MPDQDKNEQISLQLDDHDLQPDQLTNIVQQKTMAPAADWYDDDVKHTEQLVAHPNHSTDHLTTLYRHLVPPEKDVGSLDHYQRESIKHIFSSDKAPSADLNDLIGKAYSSTNPQVRKMSFSLSQNKLADHNKTKDLIAKRLLDKPGSNLGTLKTTADNIHDIHDNLKELLGPGADDHEVMSNARKSIHIYMLDNLDSLKHSPEALQRSADLILGPKLEGLDSWDNRRIREDLVRNLDFNSDQLDKFYARNQMGQDREHEEVCTAVAQNENTSPELLAKVALSPALHGKYEAMKNPSLPEEVRSRLVDSVVENFNFNFDTFRTIGQNPALTPEELTKLGNAVPGYNRYALIGILAHPNTPESLIESKWSQTDKKTDITESFLRLKRLPKSVLTDIVAKNKNQRLSIQALKHPNVDQDVIDAGLKRRAQDVKEAAARHPLVAKSQVMERIADGRLPPGIFLGDKKLVDSAGGLTPELCKALSDKLDKPAEKYTGYDIDAMSQLAHLDGVPQEIKDENVDRLASLASENPDAGSALYHLARYSSNTRAQMGLLKSNSAYLRRIDFDSTDGWSSEFIGSYIDNFEKIYEGYQDQHYQKRRLFQAKLHPNSPDEHFMDAVMNPDLYTNWPSEYGSTRHNGKDYRTVFDQRMDGKSDQEIDGFYKNLIANGPPEASRAIFYSKTAGKYAEDAFFAMDDDSKDHAVETSYDAIRDMSGEAFFEAFRSNNRGLWSFNPDKEDHISKLEDIVNHLASADKSDEIYTSPSNFIERLHSSLWDNPHRNYNEPNRSRKQLYGDIYDRLLTAASTGSSQEMYSSLVAAKTARHEFDSTDQRAEYLKAALGSPDSLQSAERWSHFLSGDHDVSISRGSVNHSDPTFFDDVGRLPGEQGQYVLQGLLRRDMLSEGFKNHVMYSTDGGFAAAIKNLGSRSPGEHRALSYKTGYSKLVENATGKSPENLKDLIESLRLDYFLPERTHEDNRKQKLEKEEVAGGAMKAQNLMGIVAASGNPDLAYRVAEAVTSKSRFYNYDQSYNKTQRKMILNGMIDHLDSIPDEVMSPADKMKAKHAIWDASSKNTDDKYLKDSTVGEIINGLIDTKNFADAVSIIKRNPQIEVAQEKLDSVLNDMHALDWDGISSAGELFQEGVLPTKNLKDLLSVAASRVGEDRKYWQIGIPSSNEEIENNFGKSPERDGAIIDHMKSMLERLHAGEFEQYNIDNRLTEAAVRIFNETGGRVSREAKKDLYLNTPSDLKRVSVYRIADNELLNDPEVVLNSTHGWKLDALIRGASGLNSDNAQVVADRASAVEDEADRYKYIGQLMEGFLQNPAVKPETIQGVFNRWGHEDKTEYIKDAMRNISKDNPLSKNPVVHLLDEAYKTLKDAFDSPGHAFGAPHSIISDIAIMLKGTTEAARSESSKDRAAEEKIDEFISNMINLGADANNSMIAKMDTAPDSISPSLTRSYIEKGIHLLNRIGYTRDVKPYGGDAIRYVDGFEDLLEKAVNSHGTDPNDCRVHFDEPGRNSYERKNAIRCVILARSRLFNHGALSTDGIKKLITDKPNNVAMLSSMKKIPIADLAPHINFEELRNSRMLDSCVADARYWPAKTGPEGLSAMMDVARRMSEQIALREDNGKYSGDAQDKFGEVLASMAMAYGESLSLEKVSELRSLAHHNSAEEKLLSGAIIAGAGGEGLTKMVLSSPNLIAKSGMLQELERKGHINEEALDKIFKFHSGDGEIKQQKSIRNLCDNKRLTSGAINKLWSKIKSLYSDGDYSRAELSRSIVKLPEIEKSIFDEIFAEYEKSHGNHRYFRAGESFNPAFGNPTHGGDLLRSIKPQVPEWIPGVDREALIEKVSYSPKAEKFQELLSYVPPEGINYADMKKANKKLAEHPDIKKIFMSAKKQTIMPEHISQAMEDTSDDYHVTYSDWSGMQTHNGGTNLVLQLNTGKKIENELAKDPRTMALFQALQKAANAAGGNNIGGHPSTPCLAGWVRIDTRSGKKGWIIEEMQSDFEAKMDYYIRDLKGTGRVGEYHMSPSEIMDRSKKVKKAIASWHEAAVQGAINLAKKQGVEKLYLHGEELRSSMSFSPDTVTRDNPLWTQQMYSRWPAQNGWEKVDYSEYPNYNKSKLTEIRSRAFERRGLRRSDLGPARKKEVAAMGSQCWMLKLT